jgi:hypothetical protein
VMIAPSRAIRSASHLGTWPLCKGRSALPARRIFFRHSAAGAPGKRLFLFRS